MLVGAAIAALATFLIVDDPASIIGAAIIGMVEGREVSMPNAKAVLAEVVEHGGDPAEIVETKGLGAISDDSELVALVDRLLAEHADQAQQLRDGKDKLIGFFVGQAMKATQGRADPGRVGELVRERVHSA